MREPVGETDDVAIIDQLLQAGRVPLRAGRSRLCTTSSAAGQMWTTTSNRQRLPSVVVALLASRAGSNSFVIQTYSSGSLGRRNRCKAGSR